MKENIQKNTSVIKKMFLADEVTVFNKSWTNKINIEKSFIWPSTTSLLPLTTFLPPTTTPLSLLNKFYGQFWIVCLLFSQSSEYYDDKRSNQSFNIIMLHANMIQWVLMNFCTYMIVKNSCERMTPPFDCMVGWGILQAIGAFSFCTQPWLAKQGGILVSFSVAIDCLASCLLQSLKEG